MTDELIRRDDMLKWVCDSDLDLAARKLIANAVRALPAVTPKVKPLVWEQADDPNDWRSGPYDIYMENGKFQAYWWSVVLGLPRETAADAMEFVWKHHESSTLASLEPVASDPLSDPRVNALVEALQAFKDFDDLPTSHKRPDVFEIRVRRKLLAALRQFGGEA